MTNGPLVGDWNGEDVTPDFLNKTTIGSGTTAQRNTITSWPKTRLFFDTDQQLLYKNSSSSGVIWSVVSGEDTGIVKQFAGSRANIPVEYLLCDGSVISRTTYAALFGIIGTRFGAGDGATTFKIPDLRYKFIRGAGNGNDPGAVGGKDAVTLTIQEMPSHTHSERTVSIANSQMNQRASNKNSTAAGSASTTTGAAGGNQAHENKPPYVELLNIIKI